VKKNMKKEHRGTYHYTECGLENVFLSGGVDFFDGPRGKQITIRDLEGLHAAIGRFLVNEKKHLSGRELRFLRHEMVMSQSLLATLLDVAEQTVHRWETGKTEVPKPAEALVRMLYNEHLGNNETVKAALKRIAALEDEMDRKGLTLIEGGNGWQPEPKKAA